MFRELRRYYEQQAKCPRVSYAEPSNEGFIIPLTRHFLVFWHPTLEITTSIVWESYRSQKVRANDGNSTNKPFKCLHKFLSVQLKNLFRSKGRRLKKVKREGRKQVIFFFILSANHFVALRLPSVFVLF